MEEEGYQGGQEGEHGDHTQEEDCDDDFVDVVVSAGVVGSGFLALYEQEEGCEPGEKADQVPGYYCQYHAVQVLQESNLRERES